MVRRPLMFVSLFSLAVVGSASFQPTRSANSEPCLRDQAWLAQLAEKLESIKPGMSRMDLLRIFKTEGRLPKTAMSAGLRRTFVSRDYPQFRVDVEFKPAGGSDSLGTVNVISPEDNRDIIVKISKPYLQSVAAD
jgi:hypothetical protein